MRMEKLGRVREGAGPGSSGCGGAHARVTNLYSMSLLHLWG